MNSNLPGAPMTRVWVAAIAASIAVAGCTRNTELAAQLDDASGQQNGGNQNPPPQNPPVTPPETCEWSGSTGLDTASPLAIAALGETVVIGTWYGMFRTADAGGSWERVADFSDDKVTMIVATSAGFFAGVERGADRLLAHSADARSWTLRHEGLPETFSVLALSTSGNDVFVALSSVTGPNVFRWNEAELAWEDIGAPEVTTSYAASAVNGGTEVAAAMYGTQVLYRTGASEWTDVTFTPLSGMVLDVWATSSGFFALGTTGLFFSEDGVYFTAGTLPPEENSSALYAVPHGDALAVAFAGGVWLTTDAQSWIRIGAPATRSYEGVRTLASNGGALFAGTGEGVLRIRAGESAWVPVNAGLSGGNIHVMLTDGPTVIAGNYTDRIWRSTDEGRTFEQGPLLPGQAQVRALARAGADRVLVGTNSGGVFLSTDEGKTFFPSNDGWPQYPSLNAPMPVQTLLARGDLVLAGTIDGVVRSANAGQSWALSNAGLPIVGYDSTTGAPFRPSMTVLAEKDGTVLAAGTSGPGMFRSEDGGRTWTSAAAGIPRRPEGNPANIDAIAFHSGVVFAAGDVWNGKEIAPVLVRSDDDGRTWTDLSVAVPNSLYGRGLVSDGEHLYLAVLRYYGDIEGAVYVSADGESWELIGGAPPSPRLSTLGLAGSRLVLGTQGSGVFTLPTGACF